MSLSKSKSKAKSRSKSRRKHRSVVKEIYSITTKDAPTYYVEAYKMIANNIEFISIAQACKAIMVTSALENEGKTNCVVNLSLALSGYGKKVCLVDCDLRKPSIHRLQRHSSGLAYVLKGEVTLDEAIFKHDDSDLDILLPGLIPPNPTELLASEKMKKIVEELKEKYDYVIFDTPPCIGISDVTVLGRYMDAAIITIKHNSTDKKIAARAKQNLENAGINVIGSILTEYDADSDLSDYSYYYSYGGYYYGGQEN